MGRHYYHSISKTLPLHCAGFASSANRSKLTSSYLQQHQSRSSIYDALKCDWADLYYDECWVDKNCGTSYFNFHSLEAMDVNQNKQSGRSLIYTYRYVTHNKNGKCFLVKYITWKAVLSILKLITITITIITITITITITMYTHREGERYLDYT